MAAPTIQLSIPSHPRYLKLVRGVIKNATRTLSITGTPADGIILAVDEACSNIIRHGYLGNTEKTIDIAVTIEKQALAIEIYDDGNIWSPAPDNETDSGPIKPGGFGIGIIRRVMDQVIYSRTANKKNMIRMVKKL